MLRLTSHRKCAWSLLLLWQYFVLNHIVSIQPPLSNLFSRYARLSEVVDHVFPLKMRSCSSDFPCSDTYSHFTYWREQLPQVEEEETTCPQTMSSSWFPPERHQQKELWMTDGVLEMQPWCGDDVVVMFLVMYLIIGQVFLCTFV